MTTDEAAAADEPIDVGRLLVTASAQASAGVADMLEAVREGEITTFDNVGSGETLGLMVDALSMLIEATGMQESDQQLYCALRKWIGENR